MSENLITQVELDAMLAEGAAKYEADMLERKALEKAALRKTGSFEQMKFNFKRSLYAKTVGVQA